MSYSDTFLPPLYHPCHSILSLEHTLTSSQTQQFSRVKSPSDNVEGGGGGKGVGWGSDVEGVCVGVMSYSDKSLPPLYHPWHSIPSVVHLLTSHQFKGVGWGKGWYGKGEGYRDPSLPPLYHPWHSIPSLVHLLTSLYNMEGDSPRDLKNQKTQYHCHSNHHKWK